MQPSGHLKNIFSDNPISLLQKDEKDKLENETDSKINEKSQEIFKKEENSIENTNLEEKKQITIDLTPSDSKINNCIRETHLDSGKENKKETSPLIKLNEYLQTLAPSSQTIEPFELLLKLNEFGFQNIDNKALMNLPEPFGSLGNLETFSLDFKGVKELPSNIGLLKNLKDLDVSENKLKELPSSMECLVNLEILHLDSNKLTECPPCLISFVYLNDLRLADNKLKELPSTIGQLKNLRRLNVSKNNINKLPSNIGQLQNLRVLNVSRNNLQKLPSNIGQLQNLRMLNVSKNNINKLPLSIELLINLENLFLMKNSLKELPQCIGSLVNLKTLLLSKNKLKELPQCIGSYVNLKTLFLSKNKLKELPSDIGTLCNLEHLSVGDNPKLTNLPLSLGQCENLLDLDIEGTEISEQEGSRILLQCQNLRAKNALILFGLRLEAWQERSGEKFYLSELFKLEDSQKEILNEWLVRLENTRDFKSKSQGELCKLVCEMLASIVKEENKEFANLFFSQVEANNECCQDRAAMALNEIYTSWKIALLGKNTPYREKLALIARGAKTIALRAAVANAIDEQQKKSDTIENEAVEIYLYYETSLKNQLHLLSAINTMQYGKIGKRDWIKEEALIQRVEDTYLDYLIEFPAFDKMVQLNDEYNELYEEKIQSIDLEIELHFEKKPKEIKELSKTDLENLEKQNPGAVIEYEKALGDYLNWCSESGELSKKRGTLLTGIKKEWVLKNLSNSQLKWKN